MFVFGYDPGGVGNAAAATVKITRDGHLELVLLETVDSVDDALEFFARVSDEETVKAAGIDAFLSWSTGRCGWRKVDTYLRTRYPKVRDSILSSNSILGAMPIQGMAMAIKLREKWPTIVLNETHPKVLYHAISGKVWRYDEEMQKWLAERMKMPAHGEIIRNEHEWDAAFSAWATAVALMETSRWRDLMTEFAEDLLFPAGKVTFRWPPEK